MFLLSLDVLFFSGNKNIYPICNEVKVPGDNFVFALGFTCIFTSFFRIIPTFTVWGTNRPDDQTYARTAVKINIHNSTKMQEVIARVQTIFPSKHHGP